MRSVLRFYDGVDSIEDVGPTSFDEIIYKWSDYKLQVRSNYLEYLFPSFLSSGLRYKFRTQTHLRKKVTLAVFRIIEMFGFKIENSRPVRNDKKLKRQENWIIVGLYNPINYSRLTKIFNFLREIRMDHLSAILFLVMCNVIKDNQDLSYMIEESGEAKHWVKTQLYLNKKAYKALFSDVVEENLSFYKGDVNTPSNSEEEIEIKENIEEQIELPKVEIELPKVEPKLEIELPKVEPKVQEIELPKVEAKVQEIELPKIQEIKMEQDNAKLIEMIENDTKMRSLLASYPKELVDEIPGTLEEKYNFLLENIAMEAKIEEELKKQKEEMERAEEIKKRIESGEISIGPSKYDQYKPSFKLSFEPFNKKQQKAKELLEFEGFGGTSDKTVGGTKAWENMIKESVGTDAW